MIEGVRPVIEALRAGRRKVHRVLLPKEGRTPGVVELKALVARLGIPSQPCENPREISPIADPYPEQAFEDLIARGGPHFLAGLDQVTDVGNLGSIARSAETAGVTGLVLEFRKSVGITPGALRASAGALEHLTVARTPNLKRALMIAKTEEFQVLVAAGDGGGRLAQVPDSVLSGPLFWIFGSEDRGVRPALLEAADYRVGIPQHGKMGSLGVAAAAAILLHETASRRST
jgi:23S rRNA (guanosine2251-2'-O)-methyltransferase